MEIILLERVRKLGFMGDVVTVKPGFARHFLLPKGKALRATKENLAFFEKQKKQYEADNLKLKTEAEALAKKMEGLKLVIIRHAGESGHLYGSVAARDITEAAEKAGFSIDRSQVVLDTPIKMLGIHNATITLHPEVDVDVCLNVAKSEEEAVLQEERGGALIAEGVAKTSEKVAPLEVVA
ncbi:uncharacterized protein LOC111320069, partial [Stylophora pistillata]|uniref:uncharacterized protein LOC111320069 n=1 Tax=Stylophora pistillata TaxID=50429 RepID=UPI000C053CA8